MKKKIPFDVNGDIFRWGPVPGRFLYVSTFVETHYKYFREKYGENWSETLWLFKDGRSFWINDNKEIQEAGKKVFLKLMLSRESREKIFMEWQGYVKEIEALEKKIDKADLNRIKNLELLDFWNKLNDLYLQFWVTGSVPELANYGSIQYLAESLAEYIKDKHDLSSVLEALTSPTKMSFYQAEEAALAKTKDVVDHQKKFFWLKNSYAGTQILPVEFFKERKEKLSLNIEKEIDEKLTGVIKRKKDMQKMFKSPKDVMEIAQAISDGIEWQDERKKHIFIILHYLDTLLLEVARRFGYDFNEMHDLWHEEVAEIINGNDFHSIIKKRERGFGVRFFHECQDLDAKQTSYFWDLYGKEKVVEGENELKGIVASRGKGAAVRGVVRILLDPSKSDIFEDGEILVAPMTSPEYIFAMRKAGAVITDAGGLTSHAAIVSRELGIPCIVGTKKATQILRTGVMVEVDANIGKVKIVKSS